MVSAAKSATTSLSAARGSLARGMSGFASLHPSFDFCRRRWHDASRYGSNTRPPGRHVMDQLTRRAFVSTLATVPFAARAAFAGQDSVKSPFPVIDTHIHLFDKTRPEG